MTFSTRGALALSLLVALPAGQAMAQDSAVQHLGISQVFNNDWFGMPFGARFDRGRTGSYQASTVWGRDAWDGALPSDPFALMEYRFRGEIIAPDNLSAPAAGDRLYAPALYFGATTHFEVRGLEVALGADLAFLGDQTGLMGLHDTIHQTFGGTSVDLSNFMIEDGIYLNTTVEGAATARAVHQLADKLNIDMPICTVVADLTTGKTDVATALNALLSRSLKEE